MSILRSSVAARATVLLVACLSSQFADAAIHFPSLFSARKSIDQSYTNLADHLYTATQSTELAGNTKAAGSLLSARPNSKEDVKQLVQAFGSLTGDSGNPESFCGMDNLANLRRVAEGLRDGGNLGPQEITGAILRLNKIVIQVIGDARKVCDPYLSAKWPKPWRPNFSDPAMERRVVDLQQVADSYLYEGFVRVRGLSSADLEWQTTTISYAIKNSEFQAGLAGRPLDPFEPNPLTTESNFLIREQLSEYVYKPCAEFVALDEAKQVLAPFNDLLKSWYLVSTGLLDKYYTNKGVDKPIANTDGFDAQVRLLAHSHQACQRFLATPKSKLARRISKFRKVENDEDK